MMRDRTIRDRGVFWTVALTGMLTAALSYGCTTLNPYTGEQKVSNTTKGAVIGAASGAAIGAIAGGGKGAAIGAASGAVAGGAVGVYMDAQERRLREQLAGSGVSVSRVGDSIMLNMPGNITFNTGSAELRPTFFDVLNSVALVLEEYASTTVEVAGHTDTTGSATFNQTLSEERAMSVASYLRSHGVSPTRIRTIGYGEQHPVADNDTTEGRKQNRRVELSLTPIVS